MHLPRMTTRRLMVAIAVVALLMGAAMTWRKHLEYARLASYYGQQLRMLENTWGAVPELFGGTSTIMLEMSPITPGRQPLPPVAYDTKEVIDYHRLLWRKYTQAARRPWLPIKPDPPYPKPYGS
jgi:hypothetical protein